MKVENTLVNIWRKPETKSENIYGRILNANGHTSPIKDTESLSGIEKPRTTYLLPKRNTPHQKRPTQNEAERMEKDIPCQREGKMSITNQRSHKIHIDTKTIKRAEEAAL